MRRTCLAAVILLLSMFIGLANAKPTATDDTARLFAQADTNKLLDNPGYIKLIATLEARAATLSDADKWHLRYLEAWQTAYVGQIDQARVMLEAVIKQSPDADMREQARGTLVNILSISHQYEEAFTTLDQALEELPHIARNSTKQHVLAEASQLLNEAGQYDLAINYADQLILIPAAADYACIGMAIKLEAEFNDKPHSDDLLSRLQHGTQDCLAAKHIVIADGLRTDIAGIYIEKNRSNDAIALLQSTYSEMSKLQYMDLTVNYDVLLAQSYWAQENVSQAEKYAVAAADIASKDDFAEFSSKAYQLLYQIARKQGDLRDALTYHEKFMRADSVHLDDVREKALAYQLVKQQVEAKKIELETLNKKNQILQLQQALDHKAVETSRLYIALLLTVLASIAFWLFRLKRSQLRFMHMARRDGLTGIFNRQHFVSETEQSLRNASKAMRCASLLLIDLDHFKTINDTHGHIAGDQVLRHAVAVCQRYLHSTDLFGRLGGEEFGILLADCSAEDAIERAEQIRRAIHESADDETPHVSISASLGIASTAHHGHDLRRLLVAADEALYRAKRDGRNRVVINISNYSPGPHGAKARERNADGHASGSTHGGKPIDYAAEK
jgi:diguanylate cyclase (GGDEF)-like protein